MSASVEVNGGRALRRTLKQAGVNIKELSAVNKKAGEVVLDESLRIVPVGERAKRAKTKRLRNTLRVFSTAGGFRIRAGSAAVPYAAPIHWGWPDRNIEPNHFITDAAETTQPKWLRLYLTHIQQILERIQGADDV